MSDMTDIFDANPRQGEIDRLAGIITGACQDYYNDTPSMTDACFDSLVDRLRALDPNHPAITAVGASVADTGNWVKANHAIPMGSQGKVNTEGELREWAPPNCTSYVVSDKLDGISIEGVYENGKLVQGITRGDGEVGEDITRNLRQIQGVLETLPEPFTGSLRGEIIMTHTAHEKYFPTYSNCRNGASGVARNTDGLMCRHLTVKWFDAVGDDVSFLSKADEFRYLERMTGSVPLWAEFASFEAVIDHYQSYIDGVRAGLDYDIDGLIVQVNNNESYESMGESDNRPLGSRAFKFPHENKPTTLESVEWQVGNTGRITPVANFETVRLAGADVSRASLHNMDIIRTLGLTHGATITVSRRNDVIPNVEAVVSPGDGDLIEAPESCPCCEEPTVFEGDLLYCRNDECSANVAGALKKWVKGINVLDWGTTVMDALVESGTATTVADLYRLDEATLSRVEMAGRVVGSSAKTMLDNLNALKPLPLHLVIGSMGIPFCARSICSEIVNAGYDTVEKASWATFDDIVGLPKMGTTKAENFVAGMVRLLPLLEELDEMGVIAEPNNGPLKGKSACFTGFRDADMGRNFEAKGGTIKSGVSRGLDYLVCKNPDSNSGKMGKARQYGTTVIGIEEFRALVA